MRKNEDEFGLGYRIAIAIGPAWSFVLIAIALLGVYAAITHAKLPSFSPF